MLGGVGVLGCGKKLLVAVDVGFKRGSRWVR